MKKYFECIDNHNRSQSNRHSYFYTYTAVCTVVLYKYLDKEKIMSILKEDQANKLQHKLSNLMENKRLQIFKYSLSDKHLLWFNSVSDSTSSHFLTVIPNCPSFKFTNKEMTVLVNHRLYIEQHMRIQGKRCNCMRNNVHPVIDDRCHHIITACPKKQFGLEIHNAAVNTLSQSMFSNTWIQY